MNRPDTRIHLDMIKHMSDAEISANPHLIRYVANMANMHMAQLGQQTKKYKEELRCATTAKK